MIPLEIGDIGGEMVFQGYLKYGLPISYLLLLPSTIYITLLFLCAK